MGPGCRERAGRGSLRLPGGPRWVGVHAPGCERDAAGASGASARVAGRAGGAHVLSHQGRKGGSGPLRGSAGPSEKLGRAREGEGGVGRCWVDLGRVLGLGYGFLFYFFFFSISNSNKV